MKAQQFYAVVAFVCIGSSVMAQENNLAALLKKLNLTDPQTQFEFLGYVDPDTFTASVACLIKGGGPGCDPRTPTIRAVLQKLSASNYQCSTCDVDTRRALNLFLRSFRHSATPLQCKSLEDGLQLTAPLCS
ncbi:uncharacterized protein LOC135215209 [Macrobrachium nipponense]|uniref:uncharacterized protein LOC135215209 n=1 Tax=Macrobrachium nipponense TaxID=159736 RepID=UPI0030C7A575